jgi:hypothetical protein
VSYPLSRFALKMRHAHLEIAKLRKCLRLAPVFHHAHAPASPAAQSNKNTAMPTANSISLNPGRWSAIRFKPSNMAKE